MKVYGVSNQGLVRANNEDSFYIDEEKGLLIIADGMGGHAGGEEASRLAVDTVVSVLDNRLFHRQPEQALKDAFSSANSAVLAKSQSDPALAGMGTTLTLAAVLPDFLVTGHIGDSKAYLIGSEGLVLTSDHSVSGQLLASGRITSAEAVNHPQRHVLTKALGTEANIDAEILRYPWSPGQHILLCSDGLTEVMKDSEIFAAVGGSGSLEMKVGSLLDTVMDRGAPDNVTIILAQL